MKETGSDQPAGSIVRSTPPGGLSRLTIVLLRIVGIGIGLLPIVLAEVFNTSSNQALHENWLAGGVVLCLGEWVIAAVLRAVTFTKYIQSFARGMLWGLFVSSAAAVFGLLYLAYYILTF